MQARFFARHGEDRRFDRRALAPISPVISQRLRSPPLVYEAGMFGRRVSDAGPWPPSVSLEHDRKRRPRIRLGGGRRIAEIGGPLGSLAALDRRSDRGSVKWITTRTAHAETLRQRTARVILTRKGLWISLHPRFSQPAIGVMGAGGKPTFAAAS